MFEVNEHEAKRSREKHENVRGQNGPPHHQFPVKPMSLKKSDIIEQLKKKEGKIRAHEV